MDAVADDTAPAAQDEHPNKPEEAENEPAAHNSHVEVLDMYNPAAQKEQAEVPEAE